MKILVAKGWEDYELIDSGYGRRLERFGKVVLDRPDSQCIWHQQVARSTWQMADAKFEDGWKKKTNIPDRWEMAWEDFHFRLRLTPFKHTGVFPEQVEQWRWIGDHVTSNRVTKKVLNLFGYTGGATLVAARAGAEVTHVDGSRPTISWARENQEMSGLQDKPIRWIVDDVLKFAKREMNRGMKYDGIIMDPPIFGHGPEGETWKFNESFPELLKIVKHLMSDNFRFLLVNAYAVSASSIMLENAVADFVNGGTLESGELIIEQTGGDRQLSTGIYARWSA